MSLKQNDTHFEAKLESALEHAKTPGTLYCPECKDDSFSPMDKLSIGMYGVCAMHIGEGYKEDNLFKLAEKFL